VLQIFASKFGAPRVFFSWFFKARSSKVLAFQTSMSNFRVMKRFSPRYAWKFFFNLVSKFENPKGFLLFMHQKQCRSQNYVPRFGFPNTFCFRSSQVWRQILEGWKNQFFFCFTSKKQCLDSHAKLGELHRLTSWMW
jgi:hypothetical protein